MHVEAWAATHELDPVMPDFVAEPFSIRKLVETGLFNGARSAAELASVADADGEKAFSDRELCVLGGYCGEPIPGSW